MVRTRTRGHPIVLVIVGAIFLITGVILFRTVGREEAKLAEISKWPKQPAKVLSAEVVWFERQRSGKHNSIVRRAFPRIVYSYEADSVRYTNETRKPSYYQGDGSAYAIRMMPRFKPGATVQVRVNPDNPYDSHLEGMEQAEIARKSKGLAIYACWIGALGMVAGTVLSVRRVLKQRRATLLA